MNSFFKTIIAGWGAKKLGGGCLSTILIFVVIYVALGQCSRTPQRAAVLEKAPTHVAAQTSHVLAQR